MAIVPFHHLIRLAERVLHGGVLLQLTEVTSSVWQLDADQKALLPPAAGPSIYEASRSQIKRDSHLFLPLKRNWPSPTSRIWAKHEASCKQGAPLLMNMLYLSI